MIAAILIAALAGGLGVYIFFAMQPTAYDEPLPVRIGGWGLQQVAGPASARGRVVAALIAFAACLIFLIGFITNQ